MGGLPLEGIRVLELTLVWAGPYGTQILADWGAEVIRIESIQFAAPATRGLSMRPSWEDMDRAIKAGFGYAELYPEEQPWNKNPLFNTHARHKLSMTVDLRRPEGLEFFKRLLQVSDVFVENNVPETIEKLGLTYDELRRAREDLIMVRMPAYGLSGRYKNYRSWGMHVEGVAGHSWLKGYPDTDPSGRPEMNNSDAGGGLSVALSTLMALRHRSRTGEGQLVEVPLCETFIPYLGGSIMDFTLNGRVQETLGNGHPSMAPHGCYPCKGEDRWVVIAVGSDEEWRGLCKAMGDPEWVRDDRYATTLGRWRNQDVLDQHIERWTKNQDHYHLMCLLQRDGVPAGPVIDERDAYNDPHIQARGFFQELADHEIGTHRHVGLMWRMAKTPNGLRRPPCYLGEHNEYVYRELLGFDEEEYDRLEKEGYIGVEPAPHVQ